MEGHAVGDLVLGAGGAELGEVLALELERVVVVAGQEDCEDERLPGLRNPGVEPAAVNSSSAFASWSRSASGSPATIEMKPTS